MRWLAECLNQFGMVYTATLKSAVCNPTKRSKVISALGATKKSQKEWDTMFVCRLKHQIYAVIGTTPAGIADNRLLEGIFENFKLST